jgi:hypothetical protein
VKEDVLEQLVDEYLMHQGYFTMHNVKFKPDPSDPDFVTRQDSVPSDIDVIAVNPKIQGPDRVIVVSCKSWQEGFDTQGFLKAIECNGNWAGKEAWRGVRELCSPKWTRAFFAAVEKATGSREFTYWTAVTSITKGRSKSQWEEYAPFKEAMCNNPIRLVTFVEMIDRVWDDLSTTPAATELGRIIQLIKASRWVDERSAGKNK